MAEGFAIDVCAYCVMSNHVHIILRTRPDLVDEWTNEEVARRWLLVFPKIKTPNDEAILPDKNEIRYLAGQARKIGEIRQRISNVSWFMRCLNEYVARLANKEDNCTGRFWEGRFKCQALLDEAAYLACMAYVDLNPVRAGIAETPEESEYTSVRDRIDTRQAEEKIGTVSLESIEFPTKKQRDCIEWEKADAEADHWLCPIGDEAGDGRKGLLPLSLDQYLDLVDWTGRQIKEGKKGAIPVHLSPILDRLSIDRDHGVRSCNPAF